LRIHALNVEEALASLKAVAGGLSAGEAARRLAEFGPNHLEEVEREHLLLRCAREFTHFFAIILWIGAALAFVAEHFDPGQGMARLGVAIVGVIVVNGIFSFWQEYKAERAVAALRRLLPQKVKTLRGGEIVSILYTPTGNWLFGTAPIAGTSWLLAIACAALMWLLEELRKAVLRRMTKD
jgi:sodium/potassium-transporting ATPase subunit alpha